MSSQMCQHIHQVIALMQYFLLLSKVLIKG